MSRKAQASTTVQPRGNASVVDKLQMLRSFIGNDASWSEKDLSTCLSQSGYSVELAAERLITGQFKSSSTTTTHETPEPFLASRYIASRWTQNMSATTIAQRTPTPPDIVTPSQPPNKKKRPQPELSSSSSSAPNVRSVTPKTPKLVHHVQVKPPLSSQQQKKQLTDPSIVESSWLLCQRWVSNGTCIQRNGSVDYQEQLELEHSRDGPPMVRFRGRRIQGQFPKHLSIMLTALLRASGTPTNAPLLVLQAEALMEERNLPVGADVAFSLSVWLPDPKAFFDLFDKARNMPSSAASQFFQKKQQTASKSTSTKRTLVHEAAFALLQWAQNGETFSFETEALDGAVPGIAPASSSGGSGSDEDDGEADEDNVDSTTAGGTAVGDEDAVPEWAQSVAAVSNASTLPEFDQASITPLLKDVELRPYQRQALHWMLQRERPPSQGCQDDLKQQLELLAELAAVASKPLTTVESLRPANMDIHCECGPVMVSPTAAAAARSILDEDLEPTADHVPTHPLWQRRYLASYDRTKTKCFYVQPLFGMATASPPQRPQPCRGGILADSMGLGKTVMLMALICQSKQEQENMKTNQNDDDGDATATLVVAPLSLLGQWEEEVETKTGLSYFVHYGDKKLEDYSAVDVVLTTYGTIQGELQALLRKNKTQQGNGSNKKEVAPKLDSSKFTGLLGNKWKRVILDEAHCIKNNSTVVSRSCCLLQAERHWCVSGTIIQNSLDDVYALFKFLNHQPWCENSFWKAAIGREPDLGVALDRVRRVLSPIMLRRTKESHDKEGKPILTLPPVETKTIMVEFTEAERRFYDELLRKSVTLFEGFIQRGTASKSWLAIFSLLHRLRQTCDHVALTVKSHIDEDDWNTNINSKEAAVASPEKVASKIAKKSGGDTIDENFLQNLMGKFRSMQAKSRQSDKEESSGNNCKAYASQVANTLNDAIKSNSSHLEEECAICLDPINVHDAVVTPCLHIFCKGCLVNVLTGNKDIDNKASSRSGSIMQCPDGPCPVCNVTLDASKILRLEQSNGRTTTSYLVDQTQGSKFAAKAVKSGEATNVGHAREVLEKAIQGSSSSKQRAIIQELHNVWEETPRSKVLVFSQFLGFLDLLENSFRSSGIPFSRLDGKLSLKERVRVLDEFGRASPERLDVSGGDPKSSKNKNSNSTKKSNIGSVLLVSMKAGGVGLNLVAASTVFISDPWWNAAVEDQCINRVHRIGQTADKVRVRKFYVSNSVEERIVKLQGRKKAMASQVLCDDEDKNGDGPMGAGMRPTLDDFKILFRED